MTAQPTIPPGPELLPCPFCGGAGDVEGNYAYGLCANHPDPEHESNHTGWVAACWNDGCWICAVEFEGQTRDEAIAAWNTRATPPVAAAPGGVLVPVEPTEAMVTAGKFARFNLAQQAREIWSAMLAAAPTPPVAGEPSGEVER